MRPFLPVTLLALLILAGCAGEQADRAPADPTESTSVEQSLGDDTADAESACEPERDQDVPSPGACASVALGASRVDVQYGSPSKKGREVFGGLVPYGEVWRTGANEATVLTTDTPLVIGGEELPAGSYSLFTIPGETEWTLIFNSVAEQWGAFEYDAGQDVLRTVATPGAPDALQEQFSISFERVSDLEALLVLEWDDVRVSVPLAATG